ncbi:MAG: alpha-L-fucosidase [Thermoproteota archaeon]
MAYKPDLKSIRSHNVLEWFHNAKIGIIVHWGLYSVPGWAPTTGELTQVAAEKGWEYWFTHNPYAEWYFNSVRIGGSPSYHYHVNTYGAGFKYDDFSKIFNQEIKKWEPRKWADLFKKAGAQYVVFTAKHHDGFLMWPSDHPNPRKRKHQVERDIVGELTDAVRERNMRMGIYYSSGIDWSFREKVVRDIADLVDAIPRGEEYGKYVYNHWCELIDRYKPSILWNDIAYPATGRFPEMVAYYYNTVSEGVINDRWMLFNPESRTFALLSILLSKRRTRSLILPLLFKIGAPSSPHFDYRTLEYSVYSKIAREKWECVRALGYSFGYNRNEGEEHTIPLRRLVHLLVDVVSKNGNLLIGVGPAADGTIPEVQRRRLLELGEWLSINGEAIYGSRPWFNAKGTTGEGVSLRFTRKGDALYAILLGKPWEREITIRNLRLSKDTDVKLLGSDEEMEWRRESGDKLVVKLPATLTESPAYTIKITPRPEA